MRIPRFIAAIPQAKQLLASSSGGSRSQVIEIKLPANQLHHLSNVLRLKAGEPIEMIDSDSSIVVAGIISSISSEALHLEISNLTAPKDIGLAMVLAIIKPTIMEELIDKAIQIGVSNFYFYHAERTKFKLSSDKQEDKLLRYNRLAEAALKQSGSSLPPLFSFHKDLATALLALDQENSPTNRFIFLANTLDSLPMQQPINFATLLTSSETDCSARTSIIIGPEGGLTEKEVSTAIKHHFKVASLGDKTLRAETAAIVAAGIFATFAQQFS